MGLPEVGGPASGAAGISPAVQCTGRVTGNRPVSAGLIRMDLELPLPVASLPGQFAMVNLAGGDALVFSRPFSILQADGADVSLLYRVVGRGTAALAALTPGAALGFLGPLGRPFPADFPGRQVVLVAGGVGLPPLHDWLRRHGDSRTVACFGARDAGDVPWELLQDRWRVSVENAPQGADRRTRPGLVTTLVQDACPDGPEAPPRVLLACGPLPMLRACADLAGDRGWDCWVSLEEHMGCGYGVCKGCVVPVRPAAPGPDGETWRNATCCQEGPVFPAGDLIWERLMPVPVPEPE